MQELLKLSTVELCKNHRMRQSLYQLLVVTRIEPGLLLLFDSLATTTDPFYSSCFETIPEGYPAIIMCTLNHVSDFDKVSVSHL